MYIHSFPGSVPRPTCLTAKSSVDAKYIYGHTQLSLDVWATELQYVGISSFMQLIYSYIAMPTTVHVSI